MRKTAFFLILLGTLNSCTPDNSNLPNYKYEVLPVDSFTLPEKFTLGETYDIKMKYKRPTDCHSFQGFYYDKNLNVRTIGIQTAEIESYNCKKITTDPIEVSFKFYVTSNGSYIFKFYKGEDANGKNTFTEVEIPVVK
jgi:hypothetical protein